MELQWKRFGVGVLGLLLAFMMFAAGCSGDKPNNESVAPTQTADASSDSNATESAAEEDVYPENGLSKTEEVTLNFGYFQGGYGREYMDHAIAKFTEKYPNVKFNMTASPTISDLISTKIAAKNDTDMFDLFSAHFPSPEEKTALMQAGVFEDLTDLWERGMPDADGKKLKEVLLDGSMDLGASMQIDGKYYELPYGGYTVGLFYDQTLFEQHGWNQSPKTWTEFLQLMEDIKSQNIIPITFPGVYAEYLHFGFQIKQFELADHKGTVDSFTTNFRNSVLPVHTSPESKAVWSRIYELGKKGYFAPGLGALNHTQSQMQVLQHKAALVITGDWVQNEMKDATPEGFKWGFMAVPFSDNPEDTVWIENGFAYAGIMIWKNKPELVKQWAKEFNLFMLTNEIQAFNNKVAGIYPIRKDFLDNPANVADMLDAPRAVMEYGLNHKVRYGVTRKDVTLTHPDAAKANKLLAEGIIGVASGKTDPLPLLEEADNLLKNAFEANN